MKKILIAEDDVSIREALTEALQSDGHEVTAVADGAAAVSQFKTAAYDLVLLDLMMPKMSGYDVCRRIREKDKRVPVIMLTAKGEEIDKVLGLELGADDYVTKPFGLRELIARVHASFRRSEAGDVVRHESEVAPKQSTVSATAETFVFGSAKIDRRRFTATIGKTINVLTARELHLLEFFTLRRGEILTRDQLLNEVWGINYQGTTRTLDQHIAQLRKKVSPDSIDGLIKTIHGTGYQYLG